MGGLSENNVILQNPVGLSFGHSQNPDGSQTLGIIRNNLALDGRDISGDPRSFAIGLGNVHGVHMYHNIIAHNEHDTGQGIWFGGLGGISTVRNSYVYENIVYQWETASGGTAFAVNENDVQNCTIFRNQFQQPRGGTLGYLINSGIISELKFHGNTYWRPGEDDYWNVAYNFHGNFHEF